MIRAHLSKIHKNEQLCASNLKPGTQCEYRILDIPDNFRPY